MTTRAAAATLGAIDDLGAFAGAYTLRRLAGPSEEPGVTEELVITEMAGAVNARPLARMSPLELACELCGCAMRPLPSQVAATWWVTCLCLCIPGLYPHAGSRCIWQMAASHVNNR